MQRGRKLKKRKRSRAQDFGPEVATSQTGENDSSESRRSLSDSTGLVGRLKQHPVRVWLNGREVLAGQKVVDGRRAKGKWC